MTTTGASRSTEAGAEAERPRDMVGKALDLLSSVRAFPEGAQAAELARDSDLPLSTAHRLLGSLVRHDYLEFEPTNRRYRLSMQIFALSQAVAQARGIAGMARPLLEDLSQKTGEASLMAVLEGNQQLYVHYVEGPKAVTVKGRPGQFGPLHCTAQGKMLVATAADPVREELVETLKLEAFGPNCITDRGKFREEIDNVQEQGWAIADEEHEWGIRAVSTPVYGPDGQAVAAISTAAPSFRASVELLQERIPLLTTASEGIGLVMPAS